MFTMVCSDGRQFTITREDAHRLASNLRPDSVCFTETRGRVCMGGSVAATPDYPVVIIGPPSDTLDDFRHYATWTRFAYTLSQYRPASPDC